MSTYTFDVYLFHHRRVSLSLPVITQVMAGIRPPYFITHACNIPPPHTSPPLHCSHHIYTRVPDHIAVQLLLLASPWFRPPSPCCRHIARASRAPAAQELNIATTILTFSSNHLIALFPSVHPRDHNLSSPRACSSTVRSLRLHEPECFCSLLALSDLNLDPR
jgi:hypothetical protein